MVEKIKKVDSMGDLYELENKKSEDKEEGKKMEENVSSSDSDDSVSEENVEIPEVKEQIEYSNTIVSNRLAAVNMDWERVNARDIFMSFSSFVPDIGAVLSVRIYFSDFGIEAMEKEDRSGPDIYVDTPGLKEKPVDENKLINYEKQKLKYYFAAIECDSINTANVLYSNLDGKEIETTFSSFDIRFIPDDVDFSSRKIKDECTNIGDDYTPIINTTGLKGITTTTQELSWDKTDPKRIQLTKKKKNLLMMR